MLYKVDVSLYGVIAANTTAVLQMNCSSSGATVGGQTSQLTNGNNATMSGTLTMSAVITVPANCTISFTVSNFSYPGSNPPSASLVVRQLGV